jgi:hypothetical protein
VNKWSKNLAEAASEDQVESRPDSLWHSRLQIALLEEDRRRLSQDLTTGFGTLLYPTCRQSESGFESYDSLSIGPSDGSATLIRILLGSPFCFPSTLFHMTLHAPSFLTSTAILLPSISIRRHLPVFNSPLQHPHKVTISSEICLYQMKMSRSTADTI